MYVQLQHSRIFMDWGKNRTNCQFLKICLDAQTEAQKEDVSGETWMYGNPTKLTQMSDYYIQASVVYWLLGFIIYARC